MALPAQGALPCVGWEWAARARHVTARASVLHAALGEQASVQAIEGMGRSTGALRAPRIPTAPEALLLYPAAAPKVSMALSVCSTVKSLVVSCAVPCISTCRPTGRSSSLTISSPGTASSPGAVDAAGSFTWREVMSGATSLIKFFGGWNSGPLPSAECG